MLWQPEEYRQRPREYDPALAELIVDQVANGGNLIELCQGNRDYPLPATFLRWVEEDPLLSTQYATALRVRTDVLVEELLHVAADHDAKRGRNQMDARKFHAERLVPAKYGPRAYQLTPKAEEDAPGIDYGAEVRRKLAQMAARAQASADAAAEAAKGQE